MVRFLHKSRQKYADGRASAPQDRGNDAKYPGETLGNPIRSLCFTRLASSTPGLLDDRFCAHGLLHQVGFRVAQHPPILVYRRRSGSLPTGSSTRTRYRPTGILHLQPSVDMVPCATDASTQTTVPNTIGITSCHPKSCSAKSASSHPFTTGHVVAP